MDSSPFISSQIFSGRVLEMNLRKCWVFHGQKSGFTDDRASPVEAEAGARAAGTRIHGELVSHRRAAAPQQRRVQLTRACLGLRAPNWSCPLLFAVTSLIRSAGEEFNIQATEDDPVVPEGREENPPLKCCLWIYRDSQYVHGDALCSHPPSTPTYTHAHTVCHGSWVGINGCDAFISKSVGHSLSSYCLPPSPGQIASRKIQFNIKSDQTMSLGSGRQESLDLSSKQPWFHAQF